MSISIDSITSMYATEYINDDNATEKMKNKIKSTNMSEKSDDELLEVCKEFETYFIEQVFKEMKKTVNEDEEGKTELSACSSTKDYFEDMLIKEYASMATQKCDLGIAQQLYEGMKRNYNIS